MKCYTYRNIVVYNMILIVIIFVTNSILPLFSPSQSPPFLQFPTFDNNAALVAKHITIEIFDINLTVQLISYDMMYK